MWEEMALRILPRLPSKSVMRFKCVRKSWYTVINNPTFVENHLSNSMHNKLSTCVLFNRFVKSDANTGEKELGFSFLYLRSDYDDAEHNVNYVFEDIKFPLSTGQFIGLEVIESLNITAHCNGIVCLCDCSDNIALCNPAIKELKLLPKSCHLPQMFQFGVGIGYDPKSKDYKILKISYDEEIYGDRLVIFPPRVEIYTLSSGSWREIKNNYLETEDTFFWPDCFEMYWEGICYWLGYEQPKEFESYIDRREDEKQKTMIFLFDTSEEVFHNILLPDCLYEAPAYRCDMSILPWNESVALFGLDDFGPFVESYGLWVMDDYDGAKASWTRHLTFKILVEVKKSLNLWKSDEILVVTTTEDIVSYNLGTDKPRILPIHLENPCILQNVVYVSSLVSVMGGSKPECVYK